MKGQIYSEALSQEKKGVYNLVIENLPRYRFPGIDRQLWEGEEEKCFPAQHSYHSLTSPSKGCSLPCLLTEHSDLVEVFLSMEWSVDFMPVTITYTMAMNVILNLVHGCRLFLLLAGMYSTM